MLAVGAMVTSSTHAGPRGRVAVPVLTRTLAQLPTVLSKGARLAGLLTARPSKARWTVALSSDVVTRGTRRTAAALGTGLSKPATRAGIFTA